MTRSQMKCSVQEIVTAFTTLDVSTFDEETLDNLLNLFPTEDQMGRFGASEMDPDVLKTVVELYIRMVQVPCVDKILHVALLKNQLAERLHQLSSNLNLLTRLATEAVLSHNLRKVLDMIPTSYFTATSSRPHHNNHHHPTAGPPAAPSLSAPLFQLVPDRGTRGSKESCSPRSTPSPPPSPSSSNRNVVALADSEVTKVVVKPTTKGTSPPVPPPPPPPLSVRHSWKREHSSRKLVLRRLGPTLQEILANRIEYGYSKLRAAGEKDSSIMRELCSNLSKQTADLMEFSIDSEISCLKDAAGLKIKSWKQCQKELSELRIQFDEAVVDWNTSIRKCVEAGSIRDMMDTFISEKDQELQKLFDLLTEVRTSMEDLFYHLDADLHKHRPNYLDADEPVVSIFIKFLDCFRITAAEIQLERQIALHLPKVNLLNVIFGADEMQLDAHQLKKLISVCPSELQIRTFKHLVGQEGSAEKAEEKLSDLLSGPKIHAKLKLLSVKKNLPAVAETLRFRLTNLLEASKEILQSVELNRVVELIGSANTSEPPPPLLEEPESTSRRASSSGLNLKLLYQLRSKRLHDLVKYIAEAHPQLLDFHRTLPHLESGTRAAGDLLTIADDMRALVKGIEVMESQIKYLQSEVEDAPDDETCRTLSLWKSFLLEAQGEYESVYKLWGETRSKTFSLVDYFHENRVQFAVRHGFEAILNFVGKFQRAAAALRSGGGKEAEEEQEEQKLLPIETEPGRNSDNEEIRSEEPQLED